MSKKWIAAYILTSIALFGLAFLFLLEAIPNMAMSPDGAATLTQDQKNIANVLGILALISLSLSVLLNLVGWIGALVASARRDRWGWFICILVFNWLAILVYLLATPPDTLAYTPRG